MAKRGQSGAAPLDDYAAWAEPEEPAEPAPAMMKSNCAPEFSAMMFRRP